MALPLTASFLLFNSANCEMKIKRATKSTRSTTPSRTTRRFSSCAVCRCEFAYLFDATGSTSYGKWHLRFDLSFSGEFSIIASPFLFSFGIFMIVSTFSRIAFRFFPLLNDPWSWWTSHGGCTRWDRFYILLLNSPSKRGSTMPRTLLPRRDSNRLPGPQRAHLARPHLRRL